MRRLHSQTVSLRKLSLLTPAPTITGVCERAANQEPYQIHARLKCGSSLYCFPLHAVMETMTGLSWRAGTQKSALSTTDKKPAFV